MASYPTTVFTKTTHATGDTIQPADVNNLEDETVAVEGGLLNGFAHTIMFSADGTYNIGASGANRPLNIFAAGSVSAAGVTVTGNVSCTGIFVTGTNFPVQFLGQTGQLGTGLGYWALNAATVNPSSTDNGTATEAQIASNALRSGFMRNLFVRSTNFPGTNNSFVFTLFQNGSATALTATVAGNATGTAVDNTHIISINPADRLSMRVSTTGNPVSSSCGWALAFT